MPPLPDDVFTMWPSSPCSSMRGTNALIPHAMPSTLTSTHQRQSFGSYSQSCVWPPGPMPALLHSTCTAPNSSTVSSARCSTDSGFVTSVTQPGDVEPVGPQRGDRVVERTGLDVGEHHLHPVLGEVPAHREPDAVGTAGDDGDLALDVSHRAQTTDRTTTDDRGDTMTVRYGARPPEQQRNREVEATSAKIWSTAVTVVWETDPDVDPRGAPAAARAVGAARPHPVRDRRTWAPASRSSAPAGSACAPGTARSEGEYALFMPMTTEQATVGGRETYGEPKKIGARRRSTSTATRCTRTSSAWASRSPSVRGTLGAPIDIAAKDKIDFYFKLSPSPDGKGFDTEPALVHVHRHEEARDGRTIDGDADAARLADRPDRRHPGRQASCRCSSRRSRRPSTARWSSGCRPTGCSRTCTSATTTSRSSGKKD